MTADASRPTTASAGTDDALRTALLAAVDRAIDEWLARDVELIDGTLDDLQTTWIVDAVLGVLREPVDLDHLTEVAVAAYLGVPHADPALPAREVERVRRAVAAVAAAVRTGAR